MSTRAMYTFKDDYTTIHVYKHQDNYPEGGISWIANARQYAWPLPRFEADDFAAAFVAANKDGRGNLRLCGADVQEPWDMSQDSQYHYIVTCEDAESNNARLCVEIREVDWWDADKMPPSPGKTIFKGTLDFAIKKFKPQWINAA